VEIETDRLLLRPLTIEDLDELVAIHSEPDVVRFMGRFDRARLLEWIEHNDADWSQRGYGRLGIVERGTARLLGRSGLKYWPQFGETEVGWVLHPDAWGRGLATEAGGACVDWGFRYLDAAYLTAMIRPDNQRSIAVAERLGFTAMREDILLGDRVVVYSKAPPSEELNTSAR
jgi:RimJ/RimL family protein N-acetyltransferase